MSPRFSIRPLATLADRRLAELAAAGDERAFETLIRRHRVELERYCWRLGLPDHHAEDVLQQAFTRAWVALRRGSEVGQPRAWLYRIVHNAAVNAHRSARLRTHEPIDAAVEGSLALAPAQDLETRLLAMDALRQVAALPHMQRRAVVMTAIEGRSHEEAAGELGVSDGAVRGLLHRARTKLRAAAAALTPQGLIELLSRSSGGAVAGPPLEVGAGVAGAGLAGVVAKGAVVTAIAGLLAGGAASQLGRHHHRSAGPPVVTGSARTSAAAAVASSSAGLDSHARRSRRSGHEHDVSRGRSGLRHGAEGRGRGRGREGSGSDRRGFGSDDSAAEPSFTGGEDGGARGRDHGSGTRSSGGDGSAPAVEVRDEASDQSGRGSRSGRDGESTPSASGKQGARGGSRNVSDGSRTSGQQTPTFAPESDSGRPVSDSGPSVSVSGGGQTGEGGSSGGSGDSEPSGSLDGSASDR